MLTAVALIALVQPRPEGAGRYEMGERLKRLDRAWISAQEPSKRQLAVGFISAAVNGFFTGKYSEVCRQLDLAVASLEGRKVSAADAISLKFDPPFAEPKVPAQLKLEWAYRPAENRAVRVAVGPASVVAIPGRELTLSVKPEQCVPELAQSPEAGVLIPVSLDQDRRSVYLSVVKGLRLRLKPLRESPMPEVRTLVELVEHAIDPATSDETDVSVIQNVFTAELLNEGRLGLERVEELNLVQHKGAYFRAVIPRALQRSRPVTVVVAVHGAGGSENMFIESYGAGLAAEEARRRGWILLSPRASRQCVERCVDWVRDRLHLSIGQVFVVGHSMGGAIGLSSVGAVEPRPAALALFSPAANRLPDAAAGLPIYLGYGKQELAMLGPSIQQLAAELAKRSNCVVREFDPCEHLMSVSCGLQDAFAFFDKWAR